VSAVSPATAEILATKRRWVELAKTAENARERHIAIAAANAALQPVLANERRQIEQQLDNFQHRQRARAILDSREYSFCLFPRQHFERLLQES
jgi:hypothetical protein